MQPLVRIIPNAIITIINARTFFMAVLSPSFFQLANRLFFPLASLLQMNTKRIVLVNIGTANLSSRSCPPKASGQ